MSLLAQDDHLEKERFFVEDAGGTWQVDAYGGILQGVVIAEIEAIFQPTEFDCSFLILTRL